MRVRPSISKEGEVAAALEDCEFSDNVVADGGYGAAVEAREIQMVGGLLRGNIGDSIVSIVPFDHTYTDTPSTEAVFVDVDFGDDWANDGYGMGVIAYGETSYYAFEGVVDATCTFDGCF